MHKNILEGLSVQGMFGFQCCFQLFLYRGIALFYKLSLKISKTRQYKSYAPILFSIK